MSFCIQHLYPSRSVLADNFLALVLLSFQEKPKIGLIRSVFLWVLAVALEGVDSLTVQTRSAAVLLGERQRRRRAREVTDMIIPECQYKREMVSCRAGKLMALTSSNPRKHLYLLIKIEWTKVIGVQHRPS